jgi:hypothetical protein
MHLHYGENCPYLGFLMQNILFRSLKPASLKWFLPKCKNSLSLVQTVVEIALS